MERLSSILDEIKDRLSSPVFSSFIISCIAFNWKIVVGLLWYDAKQIEDAGYKDHFDLIVKNFDWWASLWLPLVVALVYVVVVKNVFSAISTFATTWGERLNLFIARKGSIPTSKFIDLKKEHNKSMDELTSHIKNETTTINELKVKEQDLAKANKEIAELEAKLQTVSSEAASRSADLVFVRKKIDDLETVKATREADITSLNSRIEDERRLADQDRDIRMMDGTWTITSNLEGGKERSEVLTIQTGRVEKGNQPYAIMTSFFRSRKKDYITFVLIRPSHDKTFRSLPPLLKLYNLKFHSNGDLFGTESSQEETRNVEFKRDLVKT